MTSHAPSQRDLRTSPRYPTCFRIELVRNQQSFPATIRDLSSGGALLEVELELKAGWFISLVARELKVNAKVIRATGTHYGVQFSAPLNPLEVIRQNLAGLEHLRAPKPRQPENATP